MLLTASGISEPMAYSEVIISIAQAVKIILNSSIDKFKEDTKPNALARIKSRYLLDHIIEKEKLDATKAEVEKHAKEMASRYGVSDKELIDMYGGIEVVKYDLLVHKAIDVLKK